MARKQKTKKNPETKLTELIETVDFDNFISNAFINFALYTIAQRALPDVRDGLKPVHRRILYAMHQMGLTKGDRTKKSQQITGQVMGVYHPHGDSYGSLVYLTQEYTFWLAPVFIKGSTSDILGNTAASARYTEANVSPTGRQLFESLSKETVPYDPNYDDTTDIPRFLPTNLPTLLINGTKTAMSTGYSTEIAPHNPIDAIKATNYYLENLNKPKEQLFEEIVKILKAPDFPTGGFIYGNFEEYYATGWGRFTAQARMGVNPDNKNELIITEVPYLMAGQTNTIKEKIQDLIFENKLPGVSQVELFAHNNNQNDEEDGDPTRVKLTLTLEKNADIETIMAILYKKTPLRGSYNPRWIALDNMRPTVFNIMKYFENYVDTQHKTLKRRFKHELEKAQARKHIVEGLIRLKDTAFLTIVINEARKAKSKEETVTKIQALNFSEEQAKYIAAYRISSLNSLDMNALDQELEELNLKIYWADRFYKNSEDRIAFLLKQNNKVLDELINSGKYERRTTIIEEIQEFQEKVIETPVTLTINNMGYIKMTDFIKNKTLKDDERVINTTDQDVLVGFSSKGIMYQIPINKLRKYTKADGSRGDLADTLFDKVDGRLVYITVKSEMEKEDAYMLFISKLGLGRKTKTAGSKLITKQVRKATKAYTIKKGTDDELFYVNLITDNQKPENLLAIKTIDSTTWYKVIATDDIPEKESGSGTRVFFETRRQQPLELIQDANLEINHQSKDSFADIELEVQKPTQAFKKI